MDATRTKTAVPDMPNTAAIHIADTTAWAQEPCAANPAAEPGMDEKQFNFLQQLLTETCPENSVRACGRSKWGPTPSISS
jgi:hypothetical protein